MPKDQIDFEDPMERSGLAFLSHEPDGELNLNPCEIRRTKGTTR